MRNHGNVRLFGKHGRIAVVGLIGFPLAIITNVNWEGSTSTITSTAMFFMRWIGFD